jgi:chaperonin GroES
MKLKPLADRVLVEPEEVKEEQRASGLILSVSAQESPTKGVVLAAGDGVRYDGELVPLSVSVGDMVVYSKYGGTEIEHDGKTCLMMRESDILAIVEDES